jgi:hypothetical protein
MNAILCNALVLTAALVPWIPVAALFWLLP